MPKLVNIGGTTKLRSKRINIIKAYPIIQRN